MSDRQALHDLSRELSEVSLICTNVQIERDRLRAKVVRLEADLRRAAIRAEIKGGC